MADLEAALSVEEASRESSTGSAEKDAVLQRHKQEMKDLRGMPSFQIATQKFTAGHIAASQVNLLHS